MWTQYEDFSLLILRSVLIWPVWNVNEIEYIRTRKFQSGPHLTCVECELDFQRGPGLCEWGPHLTCVECEQQHGDSRCCRYCRPHLTCVECEPFFNLSNRSFSICPHLTCVECEQELKDFVYSADEKSSSDLCGMWTELCLQECRKSVLVLIWPVWNVNQNFPTLVKPPHDGLHLTCVECEEMVLFVSKVSCATSSSDLCGMWSLKMK